MSRNRSGKAYGHIISARSDYYRLHWTVDFYYAGSRQRHPRRFSRDTDEAGALRFAKRHGLALPTPPPHEERDDG